MNTLLVTDNFRKAIFIQAGIKCENMSPELVLFDIFIKNFEDYLVETHGLFLYFETFNNLFLILNKILAKNPNFPFVVFIKKVDERELRIMQKLAVQNIFTFPYAFRLIVAEMRVLIYKNREKLGNSQIILRQLKLDRQTRDVRYGESKINLRNREFTLLEFMMMNPGRLLSRETILEAVWDRNTEVLTNTVDVHINKLRQKIDYRFQQEFIHTINCSGYIFS